MFDMSVLVTGGAGYIGSHTALELLDKGEEVVILDDLSTGLSKVVPAEARFVEGDIGDQDLLARLVKDHKVDSIIHFAAKAIVPDSVADPLLYYRENTCKTRDLVAAAVEAGVPHMIFSSTSAVYGNPVSIPMREDGPTEPVSPYGRSKLMCEHILADVAAAAPLRYAALRYFNVAGADPRGRSGQSTKLVTHLIKVAVQAALGERAGIEVFGTDYPTSDGSCVRDYIHVTDLARGHLAALDHLRRGGDNLVLNCGYGRGYSVLEVLEVVKRVSGVDFPVTLSGRRAGDPAVTVASSDAIRARLGWTPEFDDLETIVRHAFNWEKRLAAGELAQTVPVV
jgi:UDP-glucose 4-epimerase